MDDENLSKYAKSIMDGFNTFYKKRNAELAQKLSNNKTIPLEDRVKITRELAIQKTLSSKRLKQSMDNSVKIEKTKIDKVVNKVKGKSSAPISQKKAVAGKWKEWQKKNKVTDVNLSTKKDNTTGIALEKDFAKMAKTMREQKQLKDKVKKDSMGKGNLRRKK